MKIAEPKAIVAGCAFALTLVIWGTSTLAADLIDGDILLRGGEIHIGDGSEGRVGDVAISGDTIVAVGNFEPGKFQQIIDCEGLIVCPGFIDLHNHSDRPVLQPETRAVINYLTQGCTTIVTGNCGGGPTDVGKYYRQIDELSAGVNVAHLLPQGGMSQG